MMKVLMRLFLICMIVAALGTYVEAENKKGDIPVVEIANPVYDFGEVHKGKLVKHDYTVLNKGTAPLEIKRVEPD